ncbi:MAG: alpha/beta fold hydrolase [Nocardioidaceae bacterium]|nr:alpha/beta fold hydrolase [Nocardioidaceae bacterium]
MTWRPAETMDVSVSGGTLRVARLAGPGAMVLAVHGITATHLAWIEVAKALPTVTLLAPDLRGRGRSAALPGPYGFEAHVADLVALMDATDCERVVVVGHSMGGFVAVALAAWHPERVSRLVLVDGGLPLGRTDDPPPAGGIDAVLGPAAARLAMTFPSRAAYRDFWRVHPAIGPMWTPSVQAYIDYDLVGKPPELRSSCSEEAMRVDGAQVVDHAATSATWGRVSVPTTFLRAPRGLLDAPPPLYPEESMATWSRGTATVEARTVADTNHYSILLGAAGAGAVAAAITAAVDSQAVLADQSSAPRDDSG